MTDKPEVAAKPVAFHSLSAPWVLFFADQDRGCMTFEDESKARAAFLLARERWTCSLYQAVGISGYGPEVALYTAPLVAEREPTEAMLKAGADGLCKHPLDMKPSPVMRAICSDVWRAMYDAFKDEAARALLRNTPEAVCGNAAAHESAKERPDQPGRSIDGGNMG